MEYLSLLFTLAAVIALISIFLQLNKIKQEATTLNEINRGVIIIMQNQEDFNKKIDEANAALDAAATAISSEAQVIRDFIAANQSVDTSALDGLVSRLEPLADNVRGIFVPPAPPEGVAPAASHEAEPAAAAPAAEPAAPAEAAPAATAPAGTDPASVPSAAAPTAQASGGTASTEQTPGGIADVAPTDQPPVSDAGAAATDAKSPFA